MLFSLGSSFLACWCVFSTVLITSRLTQGQNVKVKVKVSHEACFQLLPLLLCAIFAQTMRTAKDVHKATASQINLVFTSFCLQHLSVTVYLSQCCGPYDFYVAELSQVYGTSILGLHLNYLYAGPGAWTQVTRVGGEATHHYTNGAGCQCLFSQFSLSQGHKSRSQLLHEISTAV